MIGTRRAKSKWSLLAAAALLAAVLSASSYMFVRYVGPASKASTWLDNFRLAYLTPLQDQNPDVVILAINEDTLAKMPYRSPIDRGFIASILNDLGSRNSIRAIGLDLIIDQPTVPEKDRLLRNALNDSAVPIVVATGGLSAGLSVEQLAFQSEFLRGVQQGTAVLNSESGVIRTYYPFSDDGLTPTFVSAITSAADITGPREPVGIVFRRGALNSASPIRMFPAHTIDVLPEEWFTDKIVLIGADLPDRDRHRTPLSILGGEQEFMAGVMIHAQVLAQILTGVTLPHPTETTVVITTVLAAVLGVFLALSAVPARLRLLVGLLIFGAYWLAAFSGTLLWSLPLPLMEPSVSFVLGVSVATALARQQERRQRLFLRSAFNQYVSTEIIEDILDNPDHLRLGGEIRDMSFIFTDITGFSTMAERVSPAVLVSLLEGYLDGLVEIALRHKGTIARFAGDGLVIFFGAPLIQHDHSQQAVACALEFDGFCENYRQGKVQKDQGFGTTRIGVHSGKAIVGNVGGSRRFEYTAHGDCVNTAARLETANRHFGSRVCLSRDVIGNIPLSNFRPIGHVILKGKTEPLELMTTWSVLEDDDRAAYLEAYNQMGAEDVDCEDKWIVLADRLPDDALIALHLERYRAGESGWVFRLREK